MPQTAIEALFDDALQHPPPHTRPTPLGVRMVELLKANPREWAAADSVEEEDAIKSVVLGDTVVRLDLMWITDDCNIVEVTVPGHGSIMLNAHDTALIVPLMDGIR